MQQDLSLPGTLPLILERTHVSSYRAGRWFGRSWASTLDQALEIDGQGVHLLGADATVLSYPQVLLPNIACMPSAGARHPLTLTSDGGYVVADPYSGRTLHFPAPAEETGWSLLPLAAVTDRNGNRIDLVYEDRALVEVRHSGGYRVLVESASFEQSERRVTALRAPDGTALMRFGYDPVSGDLTEVIDSSDIPQRFSYDGAHRLTGWVDRNGHWYRYTYDDEGRAIRGEGSEGRLNARFAYEPANRSTSVSDALGRTTVHRYNERDQIVEETDPLGKVTRSAWDEFDRLLSRTDQVGNVTRFDYDEASNLVRIRRADGTTESTEFNELNLPVRVTEADGGVWELEYDERGNLVRETDPTGAVTVLAYDDRGGLASVTDPVGHTTRAELDDAGLPVRLVDAQGGTSHWVYDARGRLVRHTGPTGAKTAFTWTVEGRLASRTSPGGATEFWRYDGEGNAVEHIDQLGATTRTEYGPLDLPTKVVRPDGSELAYTHDAETRLVAVTNGSGLTWRYAFDAAGHPTSETDFDGRRTTYATDAAGRVTARTNGAGQTIAYVYDALGNVVGKTFGDRTTTFEYDAMGRLVQAAGPDAELRVHRDARGRILAETCNGATTAYTRDALGRVLTRRTPSDAEATWAYTATGRPMALRTGGHTLAFAHDAAGRETQRLIGSDIALAQQWNTDGRLVGQALWQAAAPGTDQARLLQHRFFAYRADGNLTGVTDRLTGARTYTLDVRGRISAVTARTWAETYAYDAADNLARIDRSSPQPDQGGMDVEAGPREYSGTLVRTAGRLRYEHDAQGRVIVREQVTLSGKRRRWTFHWDADDRLVAVDAPGGSRWHYRYDPLGRRVSKQQRTADGTVLQTFDYAWDGTRLAEQCHRVHDPQHPTARVTTWTYEPNSYIPITQSERDPGAAPQQWIDEQFNAIVTDLIGTPTELVTPGGHVTPVLSTTWGAHTAGQPLCPLRLPGQYHDRESGLHYNYLRYYDPAVAGYLSPDLLGLAPQPNPHAYVPNPTLWGDPLGLAPHNYGGKNKQEQWFPDENYTPDAIGKRRQQFNQMYDVPKDTQHLAGNVLNNPNYPQRRNPDGTLDFLTGNDLPHHLQSYWQGAKIYSPAGDHLSQVRVVQKGDVLGWVGRDNNGVHNYGKITRYPFSKWFT